MSLFGHPESWRSSQCAADCWCFQCWSTLRPHRLFKNGESLEGESPPQRRAGIKRFPCWFFTERPLVRPSNNILSCCYFGCSYWLVILIFPLKISLAPCQVFIQVRAEHLRWSVKLAFLETSQLILSLSRSPWGTKTKPVFFRERLWSANSHLWVQVRNYPICCSCFFAPFTQHALIWSTYLLDATALCKTFRNSLAKLKNLSCRSKPCCYFFYARWKKNF